MLTTNPKRRGTKQWEHYQIMMRSRTIGDYLAEGGLIRQLRLAEQAGDVTIEDV